MLKCKIVEFFRTKVNLKTMKNHYFRSAYTFVTNSFHTYCLNTFENIFGNLKTMFANSDNRQHCHKERKNKRERERYKPIVTKLQLKLA